MSMDYIHNQKKKQTLNKLEKQKKTNKLQVDIGEVLHLQQLFSTSTFLPTKP